MGHVELERVCVESLVTLEQEYAAIVSVVGSLEGNWFERTLGCIFGDDFCTLVDGVALRRSSRELISSAARSITRTLPIGLGVSRRRRFYYRPPPQWIGYPRGLLTEWLSPEFPRERALIAVPPARPVSGTARGVFEWTLHAHGWLGENRFDIEDSEAICSNAGLSGRLWRVVARDDTGQLCHNEIATLEDGNFHYVCWLESPPIYVARFGESLRRLVATIEPIPRADNEWPVDALSYWAV